MQIVSGGHDLLAVSVLGPETIHESGHNLLAYWVQGRHCLRPDTISCDTGNWESNCNCNEYNFRKTLQLVIVIVIITIFAKVICNCNDYILNVITSLPHTGNFYTPISKTFTRNCSVNYSSSAASVIHYINELCSYLWAERFPSNGHFTMPWYHEKHAWLIICFLLIDLVQDMTESRFFIVL